MPSCPVRSRPVRLFLKSPYSLTSFFCFWWSLRRYGEERVRSSKQAIMPAREKGSTAPALTPEPSSRELKAVRRNGLLHCNCAATYHQRPDRRSSTYWRKGGRYGTGPGARSVHYPGIGDRIDLCFHSLKKPKEPAQKGHGKVTEFRDAAGNLRFVPEPPRIPRYPCAEIQGHF